jgi:hypothetical protein
MLRSSLQYASNRPAVLAEARVHRPGLAAAVNSAVAPWPPAKAAQVTTAAMPSHIVGTRLMIVALLPGPPTLQTTDRAAAWPSIVSAVMNRREYYHGM